MRLRSSSSPFSVIFGKLRSTVLANDICFFPRAQNLAIDLTGRCLGQFGDELDLARIFVVAKPLAHEILDLLPESLVTRPVGDDEGLHHLPAQRVGHADGSSLADLAVLQDRVLDLDGAHGPAGRDDDIVGAAGMIEVAVLVGAAEILGRDPLAAPPDFQFADDACRTDLPRRVLDLDAAAGDWLAQ